MSHDAWWTKWFSRIERFPSTNALILFGMLLFFSTGLVIAVDSAVFAFTRQTPSHEFVDILDTWLDKVLIVMGIASGQFIGKRATTKPGLETSRAEAAAPAS
jgi:hypothetical protein